MSNKILFISHSAVRGGATILLLHFLRWFKANSHIAFDVLLGDAGELLPEFQALASTTVVGQRHGSVLRLCQKTLGSRRFDQWRDAIFRWRNRGRGYRLVYANTVCNLREMRLLSQLGIPVLCHVHELGHVLDLFVGRMGFSKVLPHISHFIVVSRSVENYLQTAWSVAGSKITLVHGFIPIEPRESLSRREPRAEFRRKLGIAENEILVGGCGTLDWRKGADIFLHIARTLRSSGDLQRIRFLWIGGREVAYDFAKFEHDLKLCGLSNAVTVVATCPNPLDYFSAMDIFALTSREDPFPLVMLEAASLGIPVVCFKESGGASEFVLGDAGLETPYLDIAAFAGNILALARDADLRQRIGANAARKVSAHHSVEQQAPKILDVIRRQLAAPVS